MGPGNLRPLEQMGPGLIVLLEGLQKRARLGEGGLLGAQLGDPVRGRQAHFRPNFSQTQVGVIVAEKEAMLGAGSEHPVRLFGSLRHQVIDQDTDVGLVTAAQDQRRLALDLPRGVDAGDEPPARRLLRSRRFHSTARQRKDPRPASFQARAGAESAG